MLYEKYQDNMNLCTFCIGEVCEVKLEELEWLNWFKRNLEVSLKSFTKITDKDIGLRSATKASLDFIYSRIKTLEDKTKGTSKST